MRRQLGRAIIFTTVVGILSLWFFGYLMPRPFANSSLLMSSGSTFERAVTSNNDLDPTILSQRSFFNDSRRTVRLTDIQIDAPGLELSSAAVRITGRQCGVRDSDDLCRSSKADTYRYGEVPVDAHPLPITIDPGFEFEYYAWLQAVNCPDSSSPDWGEVTMTFDFGEDAFPPISRSHVVHFDRDESPRRCELSDS